MIMRVYEFAKKNSIPSKKIIEQLQEGGFDIHSHMSILSEKALNFLMNLQQKHVEAPEPKDEAKKISKLKQKIPSSLQERLVVEEESEGVVAEPISLIDFAKKIGKPVNELIVTLLRWGIISTKNQVISEDIVVRLAQHYGLSVVAPTKEKKQIEKKVELKKIKGDLKERLPVIVVLGHVDHGKTTLLDFIRKTRVAIKEKGGITQHLAAYEATSKQGNIIFLDTPGHEAFSKIRQRGAKVADIAVLVLAADDGVMPQTIEAIEHAKAMNLPVIVAINKIDKVDESRIEVIKRELSQHGVLPEEWGGSAICIPISAKFGQGVDQLLDMIVLQAQIMELRASWSGAARGYVLESKFEKGRGPVATFICQNGTLKIGDYFKCGQTGGRVSSLTDSYGKSIKQAGPAIPVQVAGFVNLPEAGDYLEVISKEEYRQAKIARGVRKLVGKQLIQQEGINIVVKTDTNSSKEAVLDSINKLSKKSERKLNIVFAAVGDISESDVEFAFNTGSSIVGLHVKTEANAITLAKRRNVSITLFDVIYKLLEILEEQIKKVEKIEMVSTKIGEAIVLRVFDIKGVGVIAGVYVKEGRFSRDGKVEVWRGKEKVGEGKIVSLQREKKVVKEAHAGFECGFRVEGFDAWKVDDKVECYLDMPKKN